MIKCVAFYADCHHEVEKVTHGYRIALTYNLVLKSQEDSIAEHTNRLLEKALEDYFNKNDSANPLNLAYFLDHTYTEHGLRWNLLKGIDRANASSFYTAAKKLKLIPHLALVEIHKSWSVEGDEDDPEIGEIIEDETTFSYWIDVSNQRLPFIDYSISDDSICWTKKTEDFEPVDSEYEGYMGNYGNTMDCWYRRAAIVLWRESDRIQMNFLLNYESAINELVTLIKTPGHEEKVLEIIVRAGETLFKHTNKNKKEDFEIFTNIALYIQNKGLAQLLLSHFEWKVLDFDIAKSLINLLDVYGIDWCLELIEKWKKPRLFYRASHDDLLLENINSLVTNLLDNEKSIPLIESILITQGTSLIESDKGLRWYKPTGLKETLPTRINTVINFLKACSAIPDISIIDAIIEHLISNPRFYPELNLAELFFTLQNNIPDHCMSRYEKLKNYLINAIQEELNSGLRSKDDCSIQTTLPCKCEYCKIATDFLNSPTEKIKIWPIVTDTRNHIMSEFNDLGLPVDISVEKKGSPYKLILKKGDTLYEAAKERFDLLNLYLRKLKTVT